MISSPRPSDQASHHAGSHLVGRPVSFQLKYSDQATIFNRKNHETTLTGTVRSAYDTLVVVIVAGWSFGHTVRADLVEPTDGSLL